MAGAFLGSVSGDVPSALPGIALGSHLLLHVERALAVGAMAATALIFLMRGWEGYFPLKLSTSGAEYMTRSAASDTVRNEDEMGAMLARMERDGVALASSLREDIRELEQRIDGLGVGGKEDQ